MREGFPWQWFPRVNVAADGWTPEAVAALRQLWAEKVSGGAISIALHATRNSVIGKAHRLGLASTPSPIVRGNPQTPHALRARRMPKPSAGGGAVCPTSIRGPEDAPAASGQAAVPMALPQAAARDLPGGLAGLAHPGGSASPVPREREGRSCRWPLWADTARRGDADYGRFCDAPAQPGQSYCAGCLPRVWVPRIRQVAA